MRKKTLYFLLSAFYFLLSAFCFLNVPFAIASPDSAITENAAPPMEKIFNDVEPGNKNYVPIKFLKEKGCVQGYPDGTFHGYEEINRAEAVAMILRCVMPEMQNPITEAEQHEQNTAPFKDISTDSWFFPYITKAYKLETISGYLDEEFKPNKTINLVESIAILIRALDSEKTAKNTDIAEKPASDVALGQWFTPYVDYAMKQNALYQNSTGEIHPGKPLLRGELANILYRFLDRKENTMIEYGNASFYSGRSRGQLTEKPTAAHKELAFGSIVRVTNFSNGKTIDVEINDRGPYVPGRTIDLSRTAFETLDSLGRGIIQVKTELIRLP